MNFPDNLKYTKEHEWIRMDGDVAYIGITDFAQSEFGELVYVFGWVLIFNVNVITPFN